MNDRHEAGKGTGQKVLDLVDTAIKIPGEKTLEAANTVVTAAVDSYGVGEEMLNALLGAAGSALAGGPITGVIYGMVRIGIRAMKIANAVATKDPRALFAHTFYICGNIVPFVLANPFAFTIMAVLGWNGAKRMLNLGLWSKE